MNQSSRHSVYETLTNIVVGFAINFTLQLVVYPLLGIRIAGATNLLIVAIFTVASFLRGLALRRIFNAIARLCAIRASGTPSGERL